MCSSPDLSQMWGSGNAETIQASFFVDYLEVGGSSRSGDAQCKIGVLSGPPGNR